jgi:outer membrane protein TolC
MLLAGVGHAASLKELVDAADQHNVDKRISSEQRRTAVAVARQSWSALLPYFSAQGTWTHNQYQAVFKQPIQFADCLPDPNTGKCTVPSTQHLVLWQPDSSGNPAVASLTIQPFDQFDAVFRFDLPIIDTSRWFRIGSANASEQAAFDREDATRDNVRKQVIGTWYSYAAAIALRESAERSTKVAEEQQRLQEVRANAGAATELELLRARAEVQRNKQLVSDASVTVATTRRSLLTMTGIDPGDEAPLPPDDMRPEPPEKDLEQGVESLPAVLAADQDHIATERNADQAKFALVPVIGAQFTERLSNATGFTGQVSKWNAGAALTWRLDLPTILGINVATSQEQTAKLAAERQRLNSRDQINTDWQRTVAAIQKVEAAKALVEAAARASQVARDRYAAGAATQLDVIQADRDLLQAEVSQIASRTELGSARLSLRISAGQPLEF